MRRNIPLYLRFETKDSQPQRGNFWPQPDPTLCIDREDSPVELRIRAKDLLHLTWGTRNNWLIWKPYSQDTRESVSHSLVRFYNSFVKHITVGRSFTVAKSNNLGRSGYGGAIRSPCERIPGYLIPHQIGSNLQNL